MKIISWNVAGLRALLKKNGLNFTLNTDIDIICMQETKALESEVSISKELQENFPYRYWGENHGETQRKGLSGTCIWSKVPAIRQFPTMDFDTEGRITAVEFDEFNIVTVYTPNSQSPYSERFMLRASIWDEEFKEYVTAANKFKPTIICGDFNVAHLDLDIYAPDKHRDKSAGFLDLERNNFSALLASGFQDAFRMFHAAEPEQYTYWDQIRPHMRKNNKGWRIDYFLTPKYITQIKDCTIHPHILGSDHCPISLELMTQ